MADFARDSMLEMFTFEMGQMVEQLEQCMLQSEGAEELSDGAVNEIFRIMHTIKGSAAMMLYNNIADVSHKIEDMFFYIRENKPHNVDNQALTDIVLSGIDFVKDELAKIEAGEQPDGVGAEIIEETKRFMEKLKGGGAPAEEKKTDLPKKDKQAEWEEQYNKSGDGDVYDISITFTSDCDSEALRALTIVKNLEEIKLDMDYIPREIDNPDKTDEINAEIKTNGFKIRLVTYADELETKDVIEHGMYIDEYKIEKVIKKDGLVDENGKAGEQGMSGKTKATYVSKEVGEPHGNAKNYFKVVIKFEEGCEMENIRSYTVLRNLEEVAVALTHEPMDILENEDTEELIKRNGFKINLKTDESYDRVRKILEETVFLKEMTIEDANAGEATTLTQKPKEDKKPAAEAPKPDAAKKPTGGTMISVNINKLDSLLNLTGELVTSEAMVTQNPDLAGLELENFQKAVRQLRKIINDIQDTVMSMRMVPLSPTFAKMHRIVRDMCKQLNKDVALELVGEETEVDKNIIEHISDPLMHIIRNSVDHGIESSEERKASGKEEKGTVTLEASNAGGDVIITIKDNGGGIDKTRVMEKARNAGILRKAESEYTDKEIFNFIFLPGFSTNDDVTAYSGRGVGMDVVTTNIEQVGGTVSVDSEDGIGTTTTLKIPLTLAIINGMIIELNGAKYTIPINAIKESFKATEEEILTDPDGNEMIMVRGECYNVLRLHEFYNLDCEPLKADDGIMIMIENGEQTMVVLADELIGEQQVVVKAIPKYIKKVRGLSGCTLLGNGDISLIVDSVGFFEN